MVNMNRRMIRKRVDTLALNYVTLKDLRDDVDRYIKLHGEDAMVEEYENYENSYEDGKSQGGVFVNRPETDAEMQLRISLEEHVQMEQDARELKEFKRLKEKFGLMKE